MTQLPVREEIKKRRKDMELIDLAWLSITGHQDTPFTKALVCSVPENVLIKKLI